MSCLPACLLACACKFRKAYLTRDRLPCSLVVREAATSEAGGHGTCAELRDPPISLLSAAELPDADADSDGDDPDRAWALQKQAAWDRIEVSVRARAAIPVGTPLAPLPCAAVRCRERPLPPPPCLSV